MSKKTSFRFKKAVGQLHLWLGLFSGLIVVILGITGSIYAFIDEIKPVVYHDRFFVEDQDGQQTIALDSLLLVAQKGLGDNYPVKYLQVQGDSDRTYSFTTYEADDSEVLTYFGEVEDNRTAFVDQYSGKVLDIENTKLEFFRLVLGIHWSLLLVDRYGQNIIGIATLIFVIILISGIILWWPKNKSATKQRVWFRWKPTTKWKRKNYDLHNILGFYFSFIFLILAITGLMWAFEWMDDGVREIAGFETVNDESQKRIYGKKEIDTRQPLQGILDYAKEISPDSRDIFIGLPEEGSSEALMFVTEQSYARNKVIFDISTGQIVEKDFWNDRNTAQKIVDLQYEIHVGSILGLPGKILAFFAGLIAASLPITGFYIWWGRRKKRKRSKKPLKGSTDFSLS
ncbi:Putative transmembrane protein [Croceitalea dokdonensis DOKDO 023]|uniref:Putative transmembrane protein n=1 Tax=Croceitalea dokdonensis DOKDO 023 TaxID=1300341 RepID=A0A0P7B258_9FLAO|nr:PepSY-associated TM helix domain-containing protein [Croceitalea dokdonensis]KPM32232.1 Putative transmembrane protein [Croceitalea dokdonensis DOKDO 023]